MLDDLRNTAQESYLEEEARLALEASKPKVEKKILGMTAIQRFIISIFLLIAVIVLGSFCLLVTGKVILP
jgi:hypothetical protein